MRDEIAERRQSRQIALNDEFVQRMRAQLGGKGLRFGPGSDPKPSAEPVIVDLDDLGNPEYLTGRDVLDDAVARLVDLLPPLHGRHLEHFEQLVGKLHTSWDEFHAKLSEDDATSNIND